MHLSRLNTSANCANFHFILNVGYRDGQRLPMPLGVALGFALRRQRALQPVDGLVLDLVQDDHLVAVAADRAVVVEAVGELGVAPPTMLVGFDDDPGHRVEDAAALAGGGRAGHVHVFLLGVVHQAMPRERWGNHRGPWWRRWR